MKPVVSIVPQTEVEDASADVLLDFADGVLELFGDRLTTKRLNVEVVRTRWKYQERNDGHVQTRRLHQHDPDIQGGAKNGATGHPISLQIFRKLHDGIACYWKLVDFCNIIC